MNYIRYKKTIDNTENTTCDKCMAYIGQSLVRERCGTSCSKTNRPLHGRSYKCRVCIFIEL